MAASSLDTISESPKIIQSSPNNRFTQSQQGVKETLVATEMKQKLFQNVKFVMKSLSLEKEQIAQKNVPQVARSTRYSFYRGSGAPSLIEKRKNIVVPELEVLKAAFANDDATTQMRTTDGRGSQSLLSTPRTMSLQDSGSKIQNERFSQQPILPIPKHSIFGEEATLRKLRLESMLEKPGPKYDDSGEILKRSICGKVEWFDSANEQRKKTMLQRNSINRTLHGSFRSSKAPEVKHLNTLGSPLLRNVSFRNGNFGSLGEQLNTSRSVVQSQNKAHRQQDWEKISYNELLQLIKSQEQHLRTLEAQKNASQQQETELEKKLRVFNQQQELWSQVSRQINNKVSRKYVNNYDKQQNQQLPSLFDVSAQDYREKREIISLLESTKELQQETPTHYIWESSLRNSRFNGFNLKKNVSQETLLKQNDDNRGLNHSQSLHKHNFTIGEPENRPRAFHSNCRGSIPGIRILVQKFF